MPSYKVQQGFTQKGKTYAAGETITLSAERAAIPERIGFIKAAKEVKKAAKAPKKTGKKAAAKGAETVTDTVAGE